MSDLLPLVAAALKDKVASDASEEIAALRKECHASRRVEVIRCKDNDGEGEDENDDVVVYASAQFEEGRYGGNTNLWELHLCSSAPSCRLSDLKDCCICVGGGFPVAFLGDDSSFQGWIFDPRTRDDEYEGGPPAEDSVGVNFCFNPQSTWLTFWIQGWPREEWEAKIEEDDLDADNVMEFFTDTVSSQYPDTVVEFKEVSFVSRHIHGALKRLLPPRRRVEVRAERDARIEASDTGWHDLYYFVMSNMRELGNESGPEPFTRQVDEVMGHLSTLGVAERGEDDDLIVNVITLYEQQGNEVVERFVERFIEERNQNE